MNKVKIKPLSVNDAWQGRRTKTGKYRSFEKDVFYMLPAQIEIPGGPLIIELEFGFSSAGSDWDNPIKPFVDVLQKKYKFNDNRITKGIVSKCKVKKGNEYIKWRIYAAEIEQE